MGTVELIWEVDPEATTDGCFPNNDPLERLNPVILALIKA